MFICDRPVIGRGFESTKTWLSNQSHRRGNSHIEPIFKKPSDSSTIQSNNQTSSCYNFFLLKNKKISKISTTLMMALNISTSIQTSNHCSATIFLSTTVSDTHIHEKPLRFRIVKINAHSIWWGNEKKTL